MVTSPNLVITHLEPKQGQIDVTVNAAIDRLDNSANDPIDIVTTAGGTITVTAAQFLDNHHFRLTGSPAAGYTVDFPDGDRSFTIENASGQTATIDSVTGSVVKPTVADGVDALFAEHAVEMVLIADSTGAGGLSNVVEDTTPQLGGFLDTNSFAVRWSKGADVASGAALNLGSDGNYFDITGVTTITSIATEAVGTTVILHFDGILLLTHNATTLILPTAANITTAAGDHAIFTEHAAGNWRCVAYDRADGTPLAGGGGLSNVVEDVTPQLGGPLDTNAQAIDESEGTPVASGATTDIWLTDGNTVHITGTTTITSFATAARIGAWRKVIFDGILILTDGANLNLPGAANITTAADDFAYVYAETTTLFKVIYFKVDGSAVVGLQNIVEDATPQLGGDLDLNGNNIDFPTTANISDCLDEDSMATDSATMLATQQSIKAYADTKMADVIDDASPTLGGNLDAATFTISGHEAAINEQTGATYTFLASDSGKVVVANRGTAQTFTVGDTLPAGWHCQLAVKGAGVLTIAAGGTGNVRNRSSHTDLAGQYAMGTLFVESNAGTAPEVYLAGDTVA